MAKFPGHDLIEVISGFWFDPNKNQWDSTFFGTFHNAIKPLGYTEKQEQQGFQIRFNINPLSEEPGTTEREVTETRMVFKNPSEGTAVLLSNNYISVHKLKPYNSWEVFYENSIQPVMNAYLKLGLGKGLLMANVAYINQMIVPEGQNLAEFFGVLPLSPVLSKSTHFNVNFQSQYQFGENLTAQLRLFQVLPVDKRSTYTFECSCLAANIFQKSTFGELSSEAHDKANEIFNSIIRA